MIFISFCLFKGVYLLTSLDYELWKSSIIIFVLAWTGQFIGHKIEGKKPSFLDDLSFLLIGPAWVFKDLFNLEPNKV